MPVKLYTCEEIEAQMLAFEKQRVKITPAGSTFDARYDEFYEFPLPAGSDLVALEQRLRLFTLIHGVKPVEAWSEKCDNEGE